MTSEVELTPTEAHGFLRQMIRIRRFEEKCAELYSAGKIRGFLHLYIGQEAVAAGVIAALEAADAITATYREHGHALARGLSMGAVMAEMYGKVEGCSRGRGGSMHLFDRDKRFYGGHAIVGGHLPVAVGLGLAEKMRGTRGISVCFFGEGAATEGEFHESLNLAALWQVPVLFVCENNGYAMGTALERSESQIDLCRHARSYDVEPASVDGMDVAQVYATAKRLAGEVREQRAPRFLECRTYRFRAHSMYDPELYRDKKEVEWWKKRGPLVRFEQRLVDQGTIDEAGIAAIEAEVATELDAAVELAEAGTFEPVDDLTRDVYAPGGPR